ncbi:MULTISPECIES: putative bifunctional diguanylate cyclase/phosphodiesterase [unclassified Methylophaga]|uniref:putative bifunctional diguanylate cyclase/phosphodiesterase n=1 Tax=unclassified Methylophaga TaxID=2629249 RepID=UPI00259CBA33|nr:MULTISPECIES: GGDEF domain-containing phosphodiesterase [unclassified Methylophaga]|tara:strand:- start:16026 stop:17651 length:1626 start_codon:yes stop_codon:yes gene_type:complete
MMILNTLLFCKKQQRRFTVCIVVMVLALMTIALLFERTGIQTQVLMDLMLIPMLGMSLIAGALGAVFAIALLSITLIIVSPDYGNILQNEWLKSGVYLIAVILTAYYSHFQKKQQKTLREALNKDPGTGLPGRVALWKALDDHLNNLNNSKQKNSLAVITIENLQDIAATFSHDAADELIKQLWGRLAESFPSGADVFHYHRERLAVLFQESQNNFDSLNQSLKTHFEDSILYQGIPIHFVVHIGYVNLHEQNSRVVITQAEAAIEFSRQNDVQSAVYTEKMARDLRQSLALLGSMRTAMSSGELMLYYQPKVCLETLDIVGFEALARWKDSKMGTFAPDMFIPLIERTELIHAFTPWAVDTALSTVKKWTTANRSCPVAVNISSHNLTNPTFPAEIRSLLDKHDLPSSALELEVTETVIMKNPLNAVKVLKELADIPVAISIDDFGTGYSSLAYLHRLPATVIKIDRHFTSMIERDRGIRKIVAAAVQLAHDLGMKVVVEGIESQAQLSILRDLGCDIGQGYYFSFALPANLAETWQFHD